MLVQCFKARDGTGHISGPVNIMSVIICKDFLTSIVSNILLELCSMALSHTQHHPPASLSSQLFHRRKTTELVDFYCVHTGQEGQVGHYDTPQRAWLDSWMLNWQTLQFLTWDIPHNFAFINNKLTILKGNQNKIYIDIK